MSSASENLAEIQNRISSLESSVKQIQEATAALSTRLSCLQEKARKMAEDRELGSTPMSRERGVLIFTSIGLSIVGFVIINQRPEWPELLGLLGLGALWFGVVAIVMHYSGRRW